MAQEQNNVSSMHTQAKRWAAMAPLPFFSNTRVKKLAEAKDNAQIGEELQHANTAVKLEFERFASSRRRQSVSK